MAVAIPTGPEQLLLELFVIFVSAKAIGEVFERMSLPSVLGEIMVAAKLKFRSGLETDALVEAINAFERQLKAKVPEVRWSFIEPDNAD